MMCYDVWSADPCNRCRTWCHPHPQPPPEKVDRVHEMRLKLYFISEYFVFEPWLFPAPSATVTQHLLVVQRCG